MADDDGTRRQTPPSGEIQAIILDLIREQRGDLKKVAETTQQTSVDVASIRGSLLVGETRMDGHESRIAAVEARCLRTHEGADYEPSRRRQDDDESASSGGRRTVTIDIGAAARWGSVIGAAAAGAWAAVKAAGGAG